MLLHGHAAHFLASRKHSGHGPRRARFGFWRCAGAVTESRIAWRTFLAGALRGTRVAPETGGATEDHESDRQADCFLHCAGSFSAYQARHASPDRSSHAVVQIDPVRSGKTRGKKA